MRYTYLFVAQLSFRTLPRLYLLQIESCPISFLTTSFFIVLASLFKMVAVSSYCSSIVTMVGSLPQSMTNGNSLLGTEMAPQYPQYLSNNPMPDGYPWGNLTARTSNPYMDCPQTSVTRYYNFTVEEMTLAPDGYCNTFFLSFLICL
jgi:hypothetical protein